MQVPSPNPTTSLMPEFFIVAAGIVNAGFTLPLKRMRTWPWENAWLIWTFTALIIFPVICRDSHDPSPRQELHRS